MTPSELRPVGLRCEYRVGPLGIDERAPRLSWALESEGRGQVQSAYRLLIAQSEEDLGSEENLLWDSGRVESGCSIGVEYEGEALRSGSQCVWKVRVWDGEGLPSSYGGPAVFEMGLLESSAWEGDWISLGKGPTKTSSLLPVKSTTTWPTLSRRARTFEGSSYSLGRYAGRVSTRRPAASTNST